MKTPAKLPLCANRVKKQSRFFIIWLMLVVLTSGCGFKLKQSAQNTSPINVYVDFSQSSHELEFELRSIQAKHASINFTPNPNSPYQLIIQQEEWDQRSISVLKTGRSAENKLIYTIEYEIKSQGKSQNFKEVNSRDLVINNAQILAVGRERALVESQVRSKAVRHILNKIIAITH